MRICSGRSWILVQATLLVAVAFMLLLACACGKRGCTDPNALNYDPDATRDDGSCEYEKQFATVTLYRLNDCYDGNVELYLDGVYQKTFTSYYNQTAPSCGTNNADAVSYYLELGTYHFTATSDSSENWDFYVTLSSANDCQMVALKCGGYAEGPGVSFVSGTGRLLIWSSFDFGTEVRVKVNNTYRGRLRSHYGALPGCGETGCLTLSGLTPGIYDIYATNGTYTWNNYSVLVRDGWCNSFELK
jgi:hypothetical protein